MLFPVCFMCWNSISKGVRAVANDLFGLAKSVQRTEKLPLGIMRLVKWLSDFVFFWPDLVTSFKGFDTEDYVFSVCKLAS